MITGSLKSKIDKLWLEFWQGGITNPLTVIEQITFLMFSRMLDINETRDEKRAKRTKKEFTQRFSQDEQSIRWSNFRHIEDADALLKIVRDEVFPHFSRHAADTRFGDYMKDAQLMIQKPSLLMKAIHMINNLPLEQGDTKGDLYEYLLSKLTTAGINGQFRTPRHIIKMMVGLLDPEIDERIADPACGTAGFLISSLEYIMEKYSSEVGTIKDEVETDEGKVVQQTTYTGDLLEPEHWQHLRQSMFHGFDFDATMLRIAAMNLVMHGAEDPDIHYQDTLSQGFPEKFPNAAENAFDLVLANPPFKGMLDADDVDPAILRMVKTKKTELLFMALILRMLKLGGRSATIVPDGVLFGSSKAHQSLRKTLVDDNQLEGIISLPSGVFKPYAGVSTAIVIFTKGGQTDHVWFYDVENDGYSLDDKRDKIEQDDLPDVLAQWRARDKTVADTDKNDKTAKCFWVNADEIRGNKYDLSINRYKEVPYEEEAYDPPKEILGRLKALENEIITDLDELEGML
ncbi:MAG: N-6 DNA methylase [Methylococcales bacterium]|jgi:type I restriction enzyme M protein|nr:N-6 DNA methylase [Methylococcales bacterium]